MKNVIIYLLLILKVNTTFSQQNQPTPLLSKEDYLQKSKKQKTTAWFMLAGGSVVSFIGLTQLNFAGSPTGEVNKTPGAVLFLAGAASAFGSIHFFNVARRNRNKAMSVSFKNQLIPQLHKNNFEINAIPSLNLKISL
jgi:hypothetical protein